MAPVKKPKYNRRRHYLAEWRRYSNLTQEQASELLQIAQATLSRVERGVYPYSQDLLEQASIVYSTDPGSLIMRDPFDKANGASLDAKLAGVSAEKRATIEAVVEAMLKGG